MAITFHEGLPGHGKTWEAVIYHLLPAVKAGRRVFANIRGLNHEKIAELTGRPLAEVDMLVTSIAWDDTPRIHELVDNDSLVLIDELQDFWPAKGHILDKVTEFVTQHRHRGLDIVCMGQDLRDCHAIWKRRVENKVLFVKQTAIGRDTHYKWEMWVAKQPEKFIKVNGGTRKYDPKYFGVYKTKRDDAENVAHYADDRANILKTKAFRFWLPLAAVGGVLAISYLWHFFHASPVKVPEKPKQSVAYQVPQNPTVVPQSVQPAQLHPVASAAASAPAVADTSKAYSPEQYPVDLFSKYRPRLSAMISGHNHIEGRIEVLDDSFHLKEEFTFAQLRAMGWGVAETERGVFLTRRSDGLRYLVTQWPIDPFGRTSDYAQRDPQLKDQPQGNS
ncbi:zona occludens toxin [Silvimonas terrae]|uniref:Zona occludens toxin n=1 Tax=Silvimonas terrae TaxID=300266 RepID=A0A840RE61_9NEIS|nr:zonular occludens toxin domain-containing protein [Silvimonas terrae]MBB5190716.1 zona occludens toxin [Silvimonas terrae]